jgi:putative transposase
MRDLFYRLNHAGITVNISTFSKACKTRQDQHFGRIYAELVRQLKRQNPAGAGMLFPIDSTVITLTSKLFWLQGYHQVKLLNGINLTQRNPSECLIHFGQGHDAKFADSVVGMIPENGIGILDRGFASWDFLDQLSQTRSLFVVRIKNNMKTELDHTRYRVVWFCDLESRTEFRLATNVEMTNEEIAEIYRYRWQIEILWKFLKMHLKLDQLITKSINGVTIQIYMSLITYVILQLIEIPEFYGHQLLDKFRYLQLELSRRCSIVHWSYDLLPETLV